MLLPVPFSFKDFLKNFICWRCIGSFLTLHAPWSLLLNIRWQLWCRSDSNEVWSRKEGLGVNFPAKWKLLPLCHSGGWCFCANWWVSTCLINSFRFWFVWEFVKNCVCYPPRILLIAELEFLKLPFPVSPNTWVSPVTGSFPSNYVSAVVSEPGTAKLAFSI